MKKSKRLFSGVLLKFHRGLSGNNEIYSRDVIEKGIEAFNNRSKSKLQLTSDALKITIPEREVVKAAKSVTPSSNASIYYTDPYVNWWNCTGNWGPL